MAVLRVEVHQVREDEPVGGARELLDHMIHPFGVTGCVNRPADAASGKQVLDLADRHDRDAGGGCPIEHGFCKRLQRVVVPIRRTGERARCSDERTRDHAPDAKPLAHQLVRNLAGAVQLRDRHDVFVSGNLEHAVGGRVDNQRAGAHVLGTEVIDDLGPRCGKVADDAAPGTP